MRSPVFTAILIIAAAAAVYLVGNGRTSLLDRDEPRYAQCSRQMLQSGDWVVPHLYDQIRAKKPPGIYWCQATAMRFLGDTAFAARLPSAIATVLTLALLGAVVARHVGPRHALWTIFVFASSALTIFTAKMAMTDAVLLFFTVVAQLCVYALWQRRGGWPAAVILSLAIGCGALVKGPFILGVLAGTLALLALLKWLDRRRPTEDARTAPPRGQSHPARVIAMWFVGIAIVAALVLPWLYLVNHREPRFLREATQEARQHLEQGGEGHVGPPGYHLVLVWGTYLPWSLLLTLAIGTAFKNRRDPRVRFALASALGTWVFVEILRTKLPHYILPAFPALAFLTADAIIRCLDGQSPALKSLGIRVAAGVIAVVAIAGSTAPWWWLARRFHDVPWLPLTVLGIVGVVYGSCVWFFFHTRRPFPALISMGVGALAMGAALFGVYLPHSQPLRLSIRVADVLKENRVVEPGQVLMLDYKEPSLGFYQGGTIREAKHSLPVVQDLDSAPPWLVMTREIWNQATPEARARMQIVGAPLDGLNYSDSLRPTELLVVRNGAAGR